MKEPKWGVGSGGEGEGVDVFVTVVSPTAADEKFRQVPMRETGKVGRLGKTTSSE